MKLHAFAAFILWIAAGTVTAQIASHQQGLMQSVPPKVSDAAVARINGQVLTQRDLVREMYAIFPYAKVHNGFPKGQEEQIRRGALDMIIFEELVYQDAVRRHAVVSSPRVESGLKSYRQQFKSPDEFNNYLKVECQGSMKVLRDRIRRAILIDDALHAQVDRKAPPAPTELRTYYDKNAPRFTHPETVSIQSISILPHVKEPADATRKRAEEALRQAKGSASEMQFGQVAEKMSDDDFHVKMGLRKPQPTRELPPPVANALRTLKPGQVSGLIALDDSYTIVRLVTRTPAGKQPYLEVKDSLRKELTDRKRQQLRSELAKRLKAGARIEIL